MFVYVYYSTYVLNVNKQQINTSSHVTIELRATKGRTSVKSESRWTDHSANSTSWTVVSFTSCVGLDLCGLRWVSDLGVR